MMRVTISRRHRLHLIGNFFTICDILYARLYGPYRLYDIAETFPDKCEMKFELYNLK